MKLNFKKVIAGFGLLMLAVSVNASDVTIPNTFSNGQVADANDVNANFTAIETAVDDNDARLDNQESMGVQVFRYNQNDGSESLSWTALNYTLFTFNKENDSSKLKITWTDNVRVLPISGGGAQCAWHLTIDDNACSPSPLVISKYIGNSSADLHESVSVSQVCEGVIAGAHNLQVYQIAATNSDCYRGLLQSNVNPLGTGAYPASIIVEEMP